MLGETLAGALFLAAAVPLALPALASGRLHPGLTVLLVGLYAVISRSVKFPLGLGSVVPSYLVLVPMLLLLPPSTVPLLACCGLLLGSAGRVIARQSRTEELVFSVPDAWHTLGPALVLTIVGQAHGIALAGAYVAAFIAGCVIDMVTSSLRESFELGITPRLQGRVMVAVWIVDACFAPAGLLVAHAARHAPSDLLLLLPLQGLLILINRDRIARITEGRRRLGLVARERTRLEAAIKRVGEALSAKLDLDALSRVALQSALDALDAEAGQLAVSVGDAPLAEAVAGPDELRPLLREAADAARSASSPHQLDRVGTFVLALPLRFAENGTGAFVVARRGREFDQDELKLTLGLAQRVQAAIVEIQAHESVRLEALTDPLTRLGNRRSLFEELSERLSTMTTENPMMLMLFDLDGFKTYNDTFGHLAGDALLARLGHKLSAAVAPRGTAYRLGGDEFCVLLPAERHRLNEVVAAAMAALEERGEKFEISASVGTVLLPHEATTSDYALQLADKRMYGRKQGRGGGAREQAHDLLIHIMQARQPELSTHAAGVLKLAIPVGRRLGMDSHQLDVLARVAALHDVGKVGIPDAILSKAGPLDAEEWSFMRQHTLLGERILSAAPTLRPVATIVRASHERWDGTGYPDRLRGDEIPLAARIVAVCDAYLAMTTERCYRPARMPEAARAELSRESGRQFDPSVVAAFLDELDCQPVGLVHVGTFVDDQREALTADVVLHIRELLERHVA